jgi:parallel beta-helix repeat protein
MPAFFLTTILLIICSATVQARIIHVPGDSTTIQGGINGASTGDTVMVHPGTYYEHDIDFFGEAITVMGTDPEDSTVVASTVVDADSLGRVFHFHTGEDTFSILSGLTITGGNASGFRGGGINCDYSSSPTITKNIIYNNYAGDYGGGISCFESHSIISDNIISHNFSMWGGGVSLIESSTSLINNVIKHNEGVEGGGIYCWHNPAPIISYNDISRNMAWGMGSGILSEYSDPVISNNNFNRNLGSASTIHCRARFHSPVISNNVITRNYGSSRDYTGVVASSEACSPVIKNNLIANNEDDGISCEGDSYVLISNNTVVNNSGNDLICVESSAIVTNSIFWDDNSIDIRRSSTLTISYSDVEGGEGSISVSGTSTLNWGDGMIDEDPIFIDPDNADFHVDECSPVINQGDPDYEPESEETDIDGEDRVMNDRIDMGADEVEVEEYMDRNENGINDICEEYLLYEPKNSDSLHTINLGDISP